MREEHETRHGYVLAFADLAGLVQSLRTLTLESSIVVVSKLFDSIVPPLAAIPAFLMAIRWPGGKRSAWAGITAPTLIIARHGLEWWADWTTYTSVLYLQEIANSIGSGMGFPGMDAGPRLPSGFSPSRRLSALPPPVRPGSMSGIPKTQGGGLGNLTLPADASTLSSGT
ncbi:MAG: hypothetical protein NTV26_04820 [Caldiserica bacterium]|nr:hypothetical protein [Caldisericota bacterium]